MALLESFLAGITLFLSGLMVFLFGILVRRHVRLLAFMMAIPLALLRLESKYCLLALILFLIATFRMLGTLRLLLAASQLTYSITLRRMLKALICRLAEFNLSALLAGLFLLLFKARDFLSLVLIILVLL